MRFRFLCFAAIGIAAFSSCNNQEKVATAKKDFLADNLDTTVSPAQDFFEYANGGWIKRNPIPPDQSNWGYRQSCLRRKFKTVKRNK
jgi:putative endopeptidase